MDENSHGAVHHIELWVPDLDRAAATWGWLLTELGYELFQDWADGKSWRSGPTYIVVEQSSARIATRHDRCRPGLNHLAFHVESRIAVDKLVADAPQHGWRLMFADRHPFAGGSTHYAAYLENIDGFEAELVAFPEPEPADGPQAVEPAEAADPGEAVGAAEAVEPPEATAEPEPADEPDAAEPPRASEAGRAAAPDPVTEAERPTEAQRAAAAGEPAPGEEPEPAGEPAAADDDEPAAGDQIPDPAAGPSPSPSA